MINKFKKTCLPAKRGFTLIETLIAILVLMMAITGPLTLAEKGLHVTLIAKDQDSAFYLAQDVVEYVRWVRDTNKLHGYPWLEGLDGTNPHSLWSIDGQNGDCVSMTGGQYCTIDSLANTIASCGASGAACPVINYDSANNYFSYTSGTASIFTRTVSIATPVGGNAGEASIVVTVSWYDQGSLKRSITVRENIFDWQ